ncbi:uncharacterized protein BDR25DRAFT_361014 [Lindgomyces ingoldianus]|uniref:Uncharacterized protein n=1 Tax=Lindgomyces ingoldianus TaxID=673940 RepID=A0ACB6QES0_9PLEO|nr:uncharacterized protein BDR25DRAFT_361014 [Lindgomyces ingoldianus]KAF2465113.1 hypothetical protein BDR25DRAFT_361014 [Lindgomyces ingoldianus]
MSSGVNGDCRDGVPGITTRSHQMKFNHSFGFRRIGHIWLSPAPSEIINGSLVFSTITIRNTNNGRTGTKVVAYNCSLEAHLKKTVLSPAKSKSRHFSYTKDIELTDWLFQHLKFVDERRPCALQLIQDKERSDQVPNEVFAITGFAKCRDRPPNQENLAYMPLLTSEQLRNLPSIVHSDSNFRMHAP